MSEPAFRDFKFYKPGAYRPKKNQRRVYTNPPERTQLRMVWRFQGETVWREFAASAIGDDDD